MMMARQLLAVLLAVTISSFSAAHAQQPVSIEISTDKNTYSIGDTITITGKVSKVLQGYQPTIQVFNPKNVAYSFAQVNLTASGNFTHQFVVGGKLGIVGEYTVKVTYVGATQSIKIQLQPGQKASYMVKFAGETLDVRYVIKSAVLSRIDVDPALLSILISIKAGEEKPGSIEVTLPRALVDAKDGSNDKEFSVFVDGQPSSYKEVKTTDDSRTLLIEFPEATENVEISGTTVIPEFPFSIIIALAIGSAVTIMTARIRSNMNHSRHSNL